MAMDEIGKRVAASIPAGATQAQVAARIDLTPEKFSRALNGKRTFSAVELAQLGDVLAVDVHWLITGQPDPFRLVVAARHDFDPETGTRDVPGGLRDEQTLADINLAYRQAFQSWTPHRVDLPRTPAELSEQLGEGFVRPLAGRVESVLDVDVIRLPNIGTSYSFNVGPRAVIVIAATGNWFRENWSIAHELGHLAAKHHKEGLSPAQRGQHEAAANAFAAELLLPAEPMRALDWSNISPGVLAERIWDFGVSTDALSTRLQWLGVAVSSDVSELLTLKTHTLLRRYWAGQHANGIDEITERMDEAAARRFPRRLQEAHIELIAAGAVRKDTLAWMLGIDADALEVDEPSPPEPIGTDELAAALGN
jgi:transcriptional regulator with XRE-family HTH domain